VSGVQAIGLSLKRRLEETDLHLASGALTCLIGPNGSGKTSLLHAVAGVGRPGGRVLIDGIDPRTVAPVRRAALLGFLPASRDVKWPLTARDLIRLGGGGANMDDLLSALELAELADRRVDRLSTGERSRVLIARVLAPRPRLLLLDEPVANLDPLWQLRLMDHLRVLCRSDGCAVLVALHDLDLAARYADRLIIMEGRRIVADGAPELLLAGPAMREVFGVERFEGSWRAA
jgi:iron complex transport system ATP-binding protein